MCRMLSDAAEQGARFLQMPSGDGSGCLDATQEQTAHTAVG